MPRMERREFLRLSISACAIPLARAQGAQSAVEKTPFPYIDGLSFLRAAGRHRGERPERADLRRLRRRAGEDGRWVDQILPMVRGVRAVVDVDAAAVEGAGASGVFLATKGSEIGAAWPLHGRTAVFFQFQGCEPIGEDLTRLELFYELGLRVLQITHHNNNAWGGGAIEKAWTGLTKIGDDGVER